MGNTKHLLTASTGLKRVNCSRVLLIISPWLIKHQKGRRPLERKHFLQCAGLEHSGVQMSATMSSGQMRPETRSMFGGNRQEHFRPTSTVVEGRWFGTMDCIPEHSRDKCKFVCLSAKDWLTLTYVEGQWSKHSSRSTLRCVDDEEKSQSSWMF